jgi:hypothetical protein
MPALPRTLLDCYSTMVAILVIALVPYIVATPADLLYPPAAAARGLTASEGVVGMFAGLSVAGCAFSALLAAISSAVFRSAGFFSSLRRRLSSALFSPRLPPR